MSVLPQKKLSPTTWSTIRVKLLTMSLTSLTSAPYLLVSIANGHSDHSFCFG